MIERFGCLGMIVIALCVFYGGAYLFSLPDQAWAKRSRMNLQNSGYVVFDSNSHSGISHWLSRPWTINNPEIKAFFSVNPKAISFANNFDSDNVYLFDLLFDYDQDRHDDLYPSFGCGLLYVQCSRTGKIKISSFLEDCDVIEDIDSDGFTGIVREIKKNIKSIEDCNWYEAKAFKVICGEINCCIE